MLLCTAPNPTQNKNNTNAELARGQTAEVILLLSILKLIPFKVALPNPPIAHSARSVST